MIYKIEFLLIIWNIVFVSFIFTVEGKKDYRQRLCPIEVDFAVLQS